MSHIVAMEVLVSFLVVLFSVHAAHSHNLTGLSCVNDYVNNVSCTWHSSPVAPPGVDCWILGLKSTWIRKDGKPYRETMLRSCKLKQRKNSPPGCSFVFENEEFNRVKPMPYIRMECNGTLIQNITKYYPSKHVKMHPPGAPNVSSTANETRISWNPGSPRSDFITSFEFQVQVKKTNKSWNEATNMSATQPELMIPTAQLKGYSEVRVRVKPLARKFDSHWSDWSPTTFWEGAPQTHSTSQDQALVSVWPLGQFVQGVICSLGGVICSLGLIIVTVVLYWSCVSRGLLKGKPVPNPSKYFHSLHSVYGGNLKNWLNPLSASEPFFTVQPCDRISPVEVSDSWDVVPSALPSSSSSSSTSALLHSRSYPSAGSDTSGVVDNSSSSSSSCFSNMGYFMSSSSGSSARTDPNPAYFTYQDDFLNLHSSHDLHLALCHSRDTSPTYESLKREPLSPDSGFGIGNEDEEGNEDTRVVDVEGEEVSVDHHSPPLLILSLHLPCPPSPAPTPPNTPSLTQTSSDSQQVDVPVAAASDSYAAWPMAGAMCRSSSMPVESCKTGYLTLKELQATFSNKSI